MLKLPPMSVTTRHSASAYPFQCQAGLPLVGPIIGQEVLGQGMFCYDPFCLYETETLLSPCMLVSGNKGYGKSAFVKAYLHRQAMAGKWMAILDPKGEYLDLAERDRLSVLALRPGGPVRLNPLEAGPNAVDTASAGTASADTASDGIRGRRIGVVVALAESATGRPVTSDERSVVTAALMELERRASRPTSAPPRAPTPSHAPSLSCTNAAPRHGPADGADRGHGRRAPHRRHQPGHRRPVGGQRTAPSGRRRPGRDVRRRVDGHGRLVRAGHRGRPVRRAPVTGLLVHPGLCRGVVGPGGGQEGPPADHRGRRVLEGHP